jgi:hypothetical protein
VVKPLKPVPPPPVDQPLLPEVAVVSAIQATYRGAASEHQQKLAMEWIIKSAAAIGGQSFRADALATSFLEGRRFVGIQLMALLALNTEDLKQRTTA